MYVGAEEIIEVQ